MLIILSPFLNMSDIKEVKSMSVLIRCAMQTFPDWEIPECSLDWTVLELKKHLSLNFPTKPVCY